MFLIYPFLTKNGYTHQKNKNNQISCKVSKPNWWIS